MEIRVEALDHPNVFQLFLEDGTNQLATRNLAPGRKVYDETLVTIEKNEYRTWNPYRSKLAAAIRNKARPPLVLPGQKVLYLGAASGTTVSHVSDIVGNSGTVYAVEFSPRTIKELLPVAEGRSNIIPILGDARQPESYAWQLETVDVIYQDVAQPEQAAIIASNAQMFLRPKGRAILAIKARSVDVTKSPNKVYAHELKVLEKLGLTPVPPIELSPYVKDHVIVISIWTGK
ncbi:MAG: fibrillarin-like rRNA/tRNA 2'-O-methyltransferase [Candidatus Ranarchaeia archaeon]